MLLEQLLVPFGPKNSDIHCKTIKIVSVLQLRSICIMHRSKNNFNCSQKGNGCGRQQKGSIDTIFMFITILNNK